MNFKCTLILRHLIFIVIKEKKLVSSIYFYDTPNLNGSLKRELCKRRLYAATALVFDVKNKVVNLVSAELGISNKVLYDCFTNKRKSSDSKHSAYCFCWADQDFFYAKPFKYHLVMI